MIATASSISGPAARPAQNLPQRDSPPAGGRRPASGAGGTLDLDGEQLNVDGIAWFDHQWGDFVSVGGGGWDWFAINLDDGTDLTVSVVRDAAGRPVLEYGPRAAPGGG